LLHLASDIRYCGPVWATWTFYMERFCGYLKSVLRSRSHPWSNLNKRIINLAYLSTLAARYDLDEEL
ncbi:hypothetical protein NEOLEDRAFT_1028994, partial [Neolentinus lepideus HHB14362 ss-1]